MVPHPRVGGHRGQDSSVGLCGVRAPTASGMHPHETPSVRPSAFIPLSERKLDETDDACTLRQYCGRLAQSGEVVVPP
eukprot:1416947-Lingulodinium_polyedra.AAC.1